MTFPLLSNKTHRRECRAPSPHCFLATEKSHGYNVENCLAHLRLVDLHMEIPLFEQGESLHFERAVLYPYPDNKRVWTRLWLTAVPDSRPNIEILIFNPDGSENTSVYLMGHAEQRVETTLHVRNPQPGATYRCIVILSDGIGDTPTELERREFDLTLVFRNPDRGEPGFGFGVDWEEVARKHQESGG